MKISELNKDKCFKYTIDYTNISEDLTDFPVLLNIGSAVGKNNLNNSAIIEELKTTPELITFEGNDGDVPDPDWWAAEDLFGSSVWTPAEISGNELYRYFSTQGWFDVSSQFKVNGDFDVEAVVNYSSLVADVESRMYFYSWADIDNRSYIALDNENFKASCKLSGVWGTATKNTISGSKASLRMKREGSTYTFSYDIGNGWVALGSHTGVTSDIYFVCGGGSDTVGEYCSYSSVKVNYADKVYWNNLKEPNRKKLHVIYPSIQEHSVPEYDQYTTVLLQSDTTNGSTTFVDSAKPGRTITVVDSAQHKSESKKFGNTSMYFDGVDAALRLPDSEDWSFNSGDWTVDCWLSKHTNGRQQLFCANGDGTTAIMSLWLNYSTTDLLTAWVGVNESSNIVAKGSIAVTDTTWHHIAVVMDKGTLRLFFDGIADGTAELGEGNHVTNSTDFLAIGGAGSYPGDVDFHGYIDEFRISKGIARWVEDFTPPNSPYSKANVIKQYIHGESEELHGEISHWTKDQAQIWVKVPKVLCDQSTDLLLYYDRDYENNTVYVGDRGDLAAQQVWNDYTAVFHMSNDPASSAPQLYSSTINNVTGTAWGDMTSNDLVVGPRDLGKAITFDGNNDYMYLNNLNTFINSTTNITISADFKMPIGVTGNDTLFSMHGTSGNTNRLLLWVNNNTISFTLVNTSNTTILNVYPNITVRDDNWHNVFVSYDNSSKECLFYIDGILHATGIASSAWSLEYNGRASIGQEYDTSNSDYFNGTIAEVHISNQVLTPNFGAAYGSNGLDNLCTVTSGSLFRTAGYVKEKGQPVQREVFLYDRTSGELVDKATSDANGYYILDATTSGTHNIVCLDAAVAPDYNDLIISKITPTEVN